MTRIYRDWTETQWTEFEHKKVTISLELLDKLVNAVELLQDGVRLNIAERASWGRIHTRAEAILLEAENVISADLRSVETMTQHLEELVEALRPFAQIVTHPEPIHPLEEHYQRAIDVFRAVTGEEP
jgi:hypothetical protein